MTNIKKELKVRKTVRFDADMVALIERESNQKGKPFSETIRRAVAMGLKRCVKAKEK